jgi:oligopeptide transport system permease protein
MHSNQILDNNYTEYNDFEEVGIKLDEVEAINNPNTTYFKDAWRRLKSNKAAILGIILLGFFIIMTIFGPLMVPYKYNDTNLKIANQGFSKQHWFGTDELGRDYWARLWIGGRISLLIGVWATLFQGTIGIIIGSISGFCGGKIDIILMRIVEFLEAFPYLVWVTLLMLVTGSGIIPMILALTLTGWLSMARLVRGQILSIKQEDYIIAAKALGADNQRIIVRHMIPNSMGVIIVNLTFSVPQAIFSEAFLSFIGIGIKPPMSSWGLLVSLGMNQLTSYPMRLLLPCICISLIMLAFQLLGDGLRDALDPKLRY